MRELGQNEHLQDWRTLGSRTQSLEEICTGTINLGHLVRPLDPKLDYDRDGEIAHGPACRCDGYCNEDEDETDQEESEGEEGYAGIRWA